MSKINILFNDKNYNIDETDISEPTAELKSHLSTIMNGSGSVIEFGGTPYNVDSAKLSTAQNDFVAHLRKISGTGKKVFVNGIEYSIDSTKVQSAVDELHIVLGDLQSGNGESGDLQVVFEENTLSFAQNYTITDDKTTYYDEWYTEFAKPVELISGETYKVIWDGAEYICVAEDALFKNSIPVVLIGNKNVGNMGEDTGEPFVIASNFDYGITMAQTRNSSDSHTITIYKIVSEGSGESGSDVSPIIETLLESSVLQFGDNGSGTYETTLDATIELTSGSVYTVVWDSTEYTLTGQDALYSGAVECTVIGNRSLADIGGDTGEPFIIAYIPRLSATIIWTSSTSSTHTVAIYKDSDGGDNPLDEYNVHIAGMEILFTKDVDGYYCNEDYGSIGLVDGETYKIAWDGEYYLCTAKPMTTIDGITGIGLGNASIIGIGEDTGEPFLFGDVSQYDVCGVYTMSTKEKHTYDIYSK